MKLKELYNKLYLFIKYKLLNYDTAKHIQKFVNKHRNEIMIDPCFDLVRLIGWTEDEEDYYYIVVRRSCDRLSYEISLISCVGKLFSLPKKESNCLQHLWDINTSDSGRDYINSKLKKLTIK
jgi:hypothetical protein